MLRPRGSKRTRREATARDRDGLPALGKLHRPRTSRARFKTAPPAQSQTRPSYRAVVARRRRWFHGRLNNISIICGVSLIAAATSRRVPTRRSFERTSNTLLAYPRRRRRTNRHGSSIAATIREQSGAPTADLPAAATPLGLGTGGAAGRTDQREMKRDQLNTKN